jgi:hypothetical protein
MIEPSRSRQRFQPPVPSISSLVAVSGLVVSLACAGVRQEPVSPAEIPALEQRVSDDPNNGGLLLRYASALYAAGRCDSARVVARLGSARRPADATAPLIVGQCSEQDGDFGQALDVYREYLEGHPDAPGAATVRAREMMAARSRATARAREALERESQRRPVRGRRSSVRVSWRSSRRTRRLLLSCLWRSRATLRISRSGGGLRRC